MTSESLRTATESPIDFDEWQAEVSQAFVPLRSRPSCGHPTHCAGADRTFRGALQALPLGSVTVADVAASACVVERTPRLIRREDPGVLKVGLQLRGRSVLEQNERQAVLEPGHFAIYDTARPYRIVAEDDFATRVAVIPREMLHVDERTLEQMTAVRLRADAGLGALLAGSLHEAHEGSAGRGVGAAHLGDAILDLLAAICATADGRDGDAGDARAPRSDLLVRVVGFIDAHLGSHELNPRAIAAAHFVSVRHLQKVCAADGESVGRLIRRRRLEQVRRELADPAQAATPLASIGARAGFADPAHLSRAFKETFGCTPSTYRREIAPQVALGL